MAVRLTTPVTVISGFLGAGKTTLVNRLLRESHGQRIAVIENEFGEVGVDAEFLASGGDETIIQLANGCLCCAVRGDLARALQQLLAQAATGGFAFDRVLIETSGLADPGPVIQTFLAETAIESSFHLDGVVTLVDAVNVEREVEQVEHRAQIGYADRLLLTKCDLVDQKRVDELSDLLATLNPRAPLVPCDLNAVAVERLVEHLFDTRGFASDYVPREEVERALRGLALLEPGAQRLRHLGIARHTSDIVSHVFRSTAPLDLARLNAFIDAAIGRFGARLWRCKGIVYAVGHRQRLIVQGVQGLIQISAGTLWRPVEPRHTTLVFIGRQLDRAVIDEGLRWCVADELRSTS